MGLWHIKGDPDLGGVPVVLWLDPLPEPHMGPRFCVTQASEYTQA